jgi:hypothetical protein
MQADGTAALEEAGGSNEHEDDSRTEPESLPKASNHHDGTTNTNNTINKTSIKYHHWTVCMVPPPATSCAAWTLLTRARTELQDPGLYRWPPHVNLLYPFLNVFTDTNTTNKSYKSNTSENDDNVKNDDESSTTMNDNEHNELDERDETRLNVDILERLVSACRKCPPFSIRLERFGTFGGPHRGVLWLHPDSSYINMETNINMDTMDSASDTTKNTTEPLVYLQRLLQEEFPDCTDQRKVGHGGVYRPHMTLSHFINLQQAETAQQQVESWWPMSSKDLSFFVPEIYLLHRNGPHGQFYRVADLGLGATGKLTTHDPPVPFSYQPVEEAAWVRHERLAMQARRRKNQNQRGSGGRQRQDQRQGRSQRVPDSPDVIAAKRAARAAKRQAAEAAMGTTEDG